jgi:hypothetical protein
MTGVVGLCWEDCSDDSSCTNGKKCVSLFIENLISAALKLVYILIKVF